MELRLPMRDSPAGVPWGATVKRHPVGLAYQLTTSSVENQQQPRASRTGRTLLATGAGVPGGVRSVDGESDVAAMASLMFAAPMLASPDLGLERASGSSKGKALAGEAMAAAAPTPELGLRMASGSSKGKGLAAEAIAAACVGGPSAPRAAGVGQLYAGAYMGEPSAHKALKFTVAGLERSRRAVHQALYGTGMPAMPPGFEEDTASSASPKSPAPGFVPASQAGSPAAASAPRRAFRQRATPAAPWGLPTPLDFYGRRRNWMVKFNAYFLIRPFVSNHINVLFHEELVPHVWIYASSRDAPFKVPVDETEGGLLKFGDGWFEFAQSQRIQAGDVGQFHLLGPRLMFLCLFDWMLYEKPMADRGGKKAQALEKSVHLLPTRATC